ncbi:Protein phosphatase 1B [Atta colombica]|uniref:Protein phosphatase 1B n=1 Tax=Atta colombica TaxID=520822 RepID=A0A151I078_9HYME|nr:Protein phosphatase 1B [Atta colombica]
MGAFLDTPNTEKCNEHGTGNGLRYGVASMQGWRMEMEDAHRAIPCLDGGLSDWSYFAVFDGHAGALVSAHSAEHLLECIMQTQEFKAEDVIKGIHSGFLRLDDEMRDLPAMSAGMDKSGSTAVCAFISPKNIYIANCGDSRAVLCRSGLPVFSTRDHKPVLPAEKERIQNAGGSVMIQRVNGSLAVSRALGDYEYKNLKDRGPCEQLVSPEPEIFMLDRDDEHDEFLVLACDGIWDVMNNEDLCNFIHSRLQLTDDLEAVTNLVVDTCLYKCVYIERNLLIKRKKLFISPTSPNRSDTGCCTCYQTTSDTLMYLHTRRLLTNHRRRWYCHFRTSDTWYLHTYNAMNTSIHQSCSYCLKFVIEAYITYRSMTYSFPSPTQIFFVRS